MTINWILAIIISLLIAGSWISAAIAALVFGRRLDTQWAKPFVWLALSVSLFLAAYALELDSDTLDEKLLWGYVQYISKATLPVLYFIFAINYAKHPWTGRRFLNLFFIVPALTLVFLWFDVGGLVYREVRLVPSSLGPNVNADYGWWFWLQIAHGYSLLAIGLGALIRELAYKQEGLRRVQMIILAWCSILPVAGNVLTIFDFVEVDLTPFFILAMVMTMGYALLHLRLFEIEPVRMGVLEKMGEGFLTVDSRSRVVDFNRAAQEILQQSTWTLRNSTVDSLKIIPEEVRARLKDPTFVGRLEMTAGGPTDARTYALYVSSLANQPGRTSAGRLVLVRDITERKQLEHLRQDLMRAMVHDLRSPISTAIQYIELLHDEREAGNAPAEWQQSILQRTDKVLHRAINLIEQSLELQRLENGRIELQYEALSVNELLRYVEPLVRPQTLTRQVRLTTQIAANLPEIFADRQAIGRVLQNLIENSLKFSSPGQEIVVEAVHTEQDGRSRIQVRIQDSGPGVPIHLQPLLFQKFVRGNHEGHGFGLGLAFCKTIVEAHGERIWLENSSSNGTTFTFTLPTADR